MSVPPLFGWQFLLFLLVVLVIVAVAFFVITATGSATSERSDFERFLDARSSRPQDRAADPDDRSGKSAGGADVGRRRPPA
jgi:hypothetical protein